MLSCLMIDYFISDHAKMRQKINQYYQTSYDDMPAVELIVYVIIK